MLGHPKTVRPMKPALKYAAVAVLYATGPDGIWEHELFDRLLTHYRAVELHSLREELVSLSTVGWLHVTNEREYAGQLLRRYALAEHVRPFLRFQLDLDKVMSFLGQTARSTSSTPVVRGAV